jgi:hypothetical protein
MPRSGGGRYPAFRDDLEVDVAELVDVTGRSRPGIWMK